MGTQEQKADQGACTKALTQEQMPQSSGISVPGAIQRVNSKQLFGRAEEVEIDHNGTPYRLRQTSLGKLILTK